MNSKLPKESKSLSLEHFSYEQLQKATWAELERFSMDVLREYYRPFGLKIRRTKKKGAVYGPDGARDGEGTFIVAGKSIPAGISPHFPGLEIAVTLWVEVKKRSTSNIDRHDVGGTILSADEERVTKIVFVTNRDFTKPFRKQLARYALRRSMQFAFVNGRDLVRIAEELGKQHSARGEQRTRLRSGISKVIAETRIALDPVVPPRHVRSNLLGSVGEPVYVIADCSIKDLPRRFSRLAVDLTYEGQGNPQIVSRSGAIQNGIGIGDTFRSEFLVVAEDPCELKADGFVLSIVDDDGTRLDCETRHLTRSCRFYGTILPATIFQSRKQVYDEFDRKVRTWFDSGGTDHIDVIAIAGAGKSHLIRHHRPKWIAYGVQEVFLDGAKTNSVLEAAFAILSQVFPVPMDALSKDLEAALGQWLKWSLVPDAQAEEMARSLVQPSQEAKLPFNDQQLSAILASVLSKVSENRATVLVFEDLHKCTPPLVSLLRSVRDQLDSHAHARMLTVFTSREDSIWSDDSIRERWRASMETLRFVGGASEFRISGLTDHEAIALLQEAIPGIEDYYAAEILTQVGKTPFALREALGLLIERKAIKATSKNGVWRLERPEALKETLHTQELKRATYYRLRGICERYPAWLGDFLDSGACLGPTFELSLPAMSARVPNERAIEKAIAECRLLEILRLSPHSSGELEFDHDLIRLVLLDGMGELRQRRLARNLFEAIQERTDLELLASLAYQAGLPDRTWELSMLQVEKADRAKRHLEAVQALGLALAVTDQNVASTVFNVHTGRYRPLFDDAVAVATPISRPGLARIDRERETANLLLKYIEHLVQVGSGGSPTVGRAITEGSMLAEKVRSRFLKAGFLMYHGRMEFNQDNPVESLRLHATAEGILSDLEHTPETNRIRSENLVRLAIAQRAQNRLSASRSTLLEAIQIRQVNNWSLATQVRANYGATFFYTDWSQTRRHWTKAVRIARRLDLTDRYVHGLIDIATLDLLEDRLELAESALNEAYDICRNSGYQNSELRCLLNLGCLFLIQNDSEKALDHLREADAVGVRHDIGRRLWRVRSNMATAYYLLGKREQSLLTDEIVADSLLRTDETKSRAPKTLGVRMNMALANIILRAEESRNSTASILDSSGELWREPRRLIDALKGRYLEEEPDLAFMHCKDLGGHHFFVITE